MDNKQNSGQNVGQNSGQKSNQPQQNFQQNQKQQNTVKATPVTTSPSPVMQVAAAFVVGILVGVIGYTLVNKNQNSTAAINIDQSSASSTSSLNGTVNNGIVTTGTVNTASTATDNSVIVHTQSAGAKVTLTQIDLKNGGWVAIQEDSNGTPGIILGASYFSAGQTLNGTVSLLRPTVAGTTYLAVLHSDNGTKPRTFNYQTDTVMKDSAGNPITTSFTVQ